MPATLEMRQDECQSDVWMRRGDAWENLTRFPTPRYIAAFGSSRSGKWIQVWHGDESEMFARVSIFDSTTGRLHGGFTHYCGEVSWTPFESLIAWAGRGTEVRTFAVFDPHGVLRLHGDAWNSSFSPEGRFLLTGPVPRWENWTVQLFDLQELRVVFERRVQARGSDSDCRWVSPREAHLWIGNPDAPIEFIRFVLDS